MAAALRQYQVGVVEQARRKNVVMVGSTGIGKTFVAIMLLREQDYSTSKRAFVLAPTRQLVQQICGKIARLTTLDVQAYCGRELEVWDEVKWRYKLSLHSVYVCTPEILRILLVKGYTSFSRINLLVLDECHHVNKRHPYNQIMKMYKPSDLSMPRVFGTTACPTRDCATNIHAEIAQIDLEPDELAKFAACAVVLHEAYDTFEAHFLDKSLDKKELTKFIEDCQAIYNDLGLWCLYRFLELQFSFLCSKDSEEMAQCTAMKLACNLACTPKVDKILALIQSKLLHHDETPPLLGVVFVTRRATCRVLADYLNAAIPMEQPLFGCMLGQSASSDAASKGVANLATLLKDFEMGRFRVLISTSVSCEGVDAPLCSLVIASDPITCPRTLIQMRGRVRHTNAGLCYYLTDRSSFMADSDRFARLVEKADEIASLDFSSDKPVPMSKLPQSLMQPVDNCVRVIKVAVTGATLDLDASVACLNMYCQSVQLVPNFVFVEQSIRGIPRFRATLTMPSLLKLPQIETVLYPSKRAAKAVAAFDACKLLFERGDLDQNFNSIYRGRYTRSA
ncbi:hypothetical protein Ae201684P_003479 [Aphanomyces euteiches]|uniref:Helicase ATP-binding domain-containing protein n=2 Tax=Aphanomyces euteiches TaxID=100861 RepID=A0A6G0WNV9_9STRA|nr:hypothetical protein Ae201684_013310 [Aphanomyces euteiches]KAH9064692.1 hypothetical protein Ae201684P_003479 [Aphanomyces euteiches]KAH9151290.1 hypothetical protein AeRB84_006067 [Aphanomyces euteiches]